MNSLRRTSHPRRNRRTSKQRLRVRRPQLDVISAQRHQPVIVSSDFVLDPGGMDLLNLSDSIFCEFVHTASMDSRRAYRSARPHFGYLFRQTLSRDSGKLIVVAIRRLHSEPDGTMAQFMLTA